MSSQPFENQHWKQNWRGSSYGPMSQQPYPMTYTHYPSPTPYQMPYLMQPQIPPTELNAPQSHNQPLQLPPLQNPQRPTKLPMHIVAHPNNTKTTQPIYNI